MIPEGWTAHRRDDGEVLGWIRAEGELWVAVDRLGLEASGPVEWLEAEDLLEARGLGFLADRWWLDGEPVRISEVTPDRIVLLRDDYGAASAVGARPEEIVLPWPAPTGLTRPASPEAG